MKFGLNRNESCVHPARFSSLTRCLRSQLAGAEVSQEPGLADMFQHLTDLAPVVL